MVFSTPEIRLRCNRCKTNLVVNRLLVVDLARLACETVRTRQQRMLQNLCLRSISTPLSRCPCSVGQTTISSSVAAMLFVPRLQARMWHFSHMGTWQHGSTAMHLFSLRHATHLHKQALQHNGWCLWPSDQ